LLVSCPDSNTGKLYCTDKSFIILQWGVGIRCRYGD